MTEQRSIRGLRQITTSEPAVEGAGVHLRRAFGFRDPALFDPFLLLDDFRSDTPEDYLAGFPWHPHRGIETITYVLDGEVEHQDSPRQRRRDRPRVPALVESARRGIRSGGWPATCSG